MASIANDPNGRRRILFMAPDGRRPAIRLGKVSQRTAESVKYRVEQLIECKMLNRPMEPDLAQWVAKLHPRMAKRFAAVGLIAMPSESVGPTLKNFITEYIAARSDIKPRSTNRLESAGVKLVECFGPDRPLKDFTVGDADNFRVWLIGQGFAENTVRRLCGRAKQFFKAAMRRKLRSTRETELMETFPAHVVCGWIGNSEAIALKHYLQVTDDHFKRPCGARRTPTPGPPKTALKKRRSMRTRVAAGSSTR